MARKIFEHRLRKRIPLENQLEDKFVKIQVENIRIPPDNKNFP